MVVDEIIFEEERPQVTAVSSKTRSMIPMSIGGAAFVVVMVVVLGAIYMTRRERTPTFESRL